MIPSLLHHADVTHHYTVEEKDLNGYGIMHGGRMLTLCDEVSYLAAHRHAGTACLTRAVHRARFQRGIHLGASLSIRASVGLVGHSSLWVPVAIYTPKENNPDCEEIAMDAIFVFAAIDEQQASTAVPPLDIQTKHAQALHAYLESLRTQIINTP